jgi:hypothetical protein
MNEPEFRALSREPDTTLVLCDESHPSSARLLRVLSIAIVATADADSAALIASMRQHGGNLSITYRAQPPVSFMVALRKAWQVIDGSPETWHFLNGKEIK